MTPMIRTALRTAFVLTILAATIAARQKDAPSLAGTWRGSVTAEMGEMAIGLTITIEKGIARGEIATGHGPFTIAGGTVAEGKWTLPFSTPEGLKGKMTGVIKGDDFTGEWDARPMALGTFAVTREK